MVAICPFPEPLLSLTSQAHIAHPPRPTQTPDRDQTPTPEAHPTASISPASGPKLASTMPDHPRMALAVKVAVLETAVPPSTCPYRVHTLQVRTGAMDAAIPKIATPRRTHLPGPTSSSPDPTKTRTIPWNCVGCGRHLLHPQPRQSTIASVTSPQPLLAFPSAAISAQSSDLPSPLDRVFLRRTSAKRAYITRVHQGQNSGDTQQDHAPVHTLCTRPAGWARSI